MILDFDEPKKVRSTEEHNKTYQSDSGVDGTFVPNMPKQDMMKWKAKKVGGDDPRVEIRKTVEGYDPVLQRQQNNRGYAGKFAGHCAAQVLVIVRPHSVIMSANGRAVWGLQDWKELHQAVTEAREAFDEF
jgi:hypothetical protein